MSIDSKYIIQYEGPFGTGEFENQLESLNNIPGSFGFEKFGYDCIIGEIKHSDDEIILDIIKKSTPIQVLKSQDTFWQEIFNIKNNLKK